MGRHRRWPGEPPTSYNQQTTGYRWFGNHADDARRTAAMANSSTPFGFMPYGRLNGGSPTEELSKFGISSADTSLHFTGDLVAQSTTGSTPGPVLMLSSQACIGMEDGNVVPAGVFWGVKIFNATVGRTIWSRFYDGTVVTGGGEAYVITDPNVLFRCVCGTSGAGATMANADIGGNLRLLSSQSSMGNTTTGQSVQLLSSTVTFDTSAPFRIFDLLANRSVSGTPGTDAAAYNQIIVAPNLWATRAGTVSAST